MLNVFSSNRTERLTAALLALTAEPLHSPAEPELVVASTPTVTRWLTLRFADMGGVCANVQFLYPARFVWEMFRRILGDALPGDAPFTPEANTWRIFSLLSAVPDSVNYAPITNYLRSSGPRQRFELSRQIAQCFDQYLVFRPDWVREWEAGAHSHWQADLWRRMLADRRPLHWVHALDAFNKAMSSGESHSLPARVSLFAVSTLSPSYLDVISQLSRHMQVNLLLLNPCRQYWGDIVSSRALAANSEETVSARHFESGHRLLASLGRPGRDFLDQIIESEHQEVEDYEPPSGDTLLARLQADILDLRSRGGAEHPRVSIDHADRSIQVHACHSAMREVEVLHDQLLSMFEQWPELNPSQVLVAVTDIARYAPYVSGVFGAIEGARHIPYSGVDPADISAEPLVEVLEALLELPRSRFDVNAILAPLELGAVQRRFELDDESLASIRRWIDAAGIRWGWDATQRAELQVPATTEHTWRAGMDRLLLGYALPGDDSQLFNGVLPCGEVEGMAARTFSSLLRYLDTLTYWRTELAKPRAIDAWGGALNALLDGVFAPDAGDERVTQAIRDAIAAIASDAAAGDCSEPVESEVMAAELRRRLAAGGSGHLPFRGGVLFAQLAAVRALPFDVICILGMNDGVFPSLTRRVDFDLMARDWRRGDRSRRDDDRYLFLETLLSARRCLYLSYVGSDIRTNANLPPSVLISELLDEVEHGFDLAGAGDIRAHLLTRHPMQAFSERYFSGDPRLFSYRHECLVPPSSAEASSLRPPLLRAALPMSPGLSCVTPEQFTNFFGHPVRAFIEQRLRVFLREYDDTLATDEPFALTRRDAERLRDRLAARELAGTAVANGYLVEAARGVLPHGQVGRVVYDEAERDAVALAENLQRHGWSRTQIPSRLDIDIAIANIQVTGSLDSIHERGVFAYRAVDAIDCWQRVRFWLQHLLLGAAAPERAGASVLVTLEKTIRLRAITDPKSELERLAGMFLRGQNEPLHFFPRSAEAYVKSARSARRRNDGPDAALVAARRTWRGNDKYKGESSDPYYRLAFGASDPLDADFEELAQTILAPMFDNTEEL